MLVDLRRDLENQMRGLLKSLGFVFAKAGPWALPRRINDLLCDAPQLRSLLEPLMAAHAALAAQVTPGSTSSPKPVAQYAGS